MKIIDRKRCVIGEGPIWNEKENKLYYTNGLDNELRIIDIYTGEKTIRKPDVGCAAYAFTNDNRLIVSRCDGVFILNDDDTTEKLYDTEKYKIQYANDMKVGPDGRIYVGTQSQKRIGVSDKIDGKLYNIDRYGEVKVLIDNISLSNGLEWSMDEKYFYHTDSDTSIIKEYEFDKTNGDILPTGREISVIGVDGFTINKKDEIIAACRGQGHIAVADAKTMKIKKYVDVPTKISASCAFVGNDMEYLAIVTASCNGDLELDKNAGFTFLHKVKAGGRKPFLFSKNKE